MAKFKVTMPVDDVFEADSAEEAAQGMAAMMYESETVLNATFVVENLDTGAKATFYGENLL